jgi:hypothetical protein
MAVAGIQGIFSKLNNVERTTSSFRQAANDGNRNISKFAKDISSIFSEVRRELKGVNDSASSSSSSEQQAASKLETNNSLLQESIAVQNSMLAEIRKMRNDIKDLSGKEEGGIVSKAVNAATSVGSAVAGGGLVKSMLTRFGGPLATAVGGAAALATGYSMSGGGNDSGSAINNNAVATQSAPGTKNAGELVGLAKQAGFNDEQAKTMAAIAMAESSGKTNAHNPNARTGDNSYGLWQINMLGNMGPQRRREFGIESNEELFDPIKNAKAAKKVFDQQGFNAWSVYKNGAYQRFIPQVAASGTAAAAAAAPIPMAPAGSATRTPAPTATQMPTPSTGGMTPPVDSGGSQGSTGSADTPSTTGSGQTQTGRTGDGHQGALEKGAQSGIAQKLKEIESSFGGRLNVTSGHRDAAHNARVGGAQNSAHTRGNAVDVTFNGGVPETLKLIEAASKAGIGGIGVYRPGSVHLDTENRRSWGPSYGRESVPNWAEAAIRAHETGKWGEYDASARGGDSGDGARQGANYGNMPSPMDYMNMTMSGGIGGFGGMGMMGGMGSPMGMSRGPGSDVASALGMMSGMIGGQAGMIGGGIAQLLPGVLGIVGSLFGGGSNAPPQQANVMGNGSQDLERRQTAQATIRQNAVESRARQETAEEAAGR